MSVKKVSQEFEKVFRAGITQFYAVYIDYEQGASPIKENIEEKQHEMENGKINEN